MRRSVRRNVVGRFFLSRVRPGRRPRAIGWMRRLASVVVLVGNKNGHGGA